MGSADVLCWSRAGDGSESVNQMWLIMKPACDGDFSEGHSSALEQADGSVNAQPQNKLMWRQTHCAAEQTREMEWTDMGLFGQGGQRQVIGEIRVHELHNRTQLE